MGGLRARAAANRRFTAAVNLRLGLLAGVSIYLGMVAAGDLDTFFNSEFYRGVLVGRIGWPALLAGLLIGAVVVLTWQARRAVVIAAALLAAAAAGFAGFSAGERTFVITQVVCLAAVVALTVRMERRSPAWLWFVIAVVAMLFLPGYLQYFTYLWLYVGPGMELCVVVVALAWVAIDARPLVAVAAYLLLWSVPLTLEELAWGAGNWFANPGLFFACAIAALAVWRLRRQSARAVQ